MDYKDRESFQGAVKARLSSLVVGTPTSIFNYFNPQSTAEGNSRRVIFVQHEGIMKPLNIKKLTTDELDFVHAELDRLQTLSQRTVYHQKIENAAANWRTKIQQLANKDEILHRAAHTPTEMYKRTAYLMWALFDFDEKKIKNCCELAELVAEYQYRQYINLTYAEQKDEKKKWQQKLPPTTQQTQENFNKQMLEDMPNIFTKQDVVNYRLAKQYPHNPKSYHILTRWKLAGLITQLEDKSFQKL